MADAELSPIKVVLPSNDDFRDPGTPGRTFAPLCVVDQAYRQKFAAEVNAVRQEFAAALADGLPAVAKAILKNEAQSKSYRPNEILNPDTCPIIGVGSAGELYASVTPEGLARLENMIASAASQKAIAHLSTLNAITPFSANDESAVDAASTAGRTRRRSLRVKLFRHGDEGLDARLDAAFEQYARKAGVGQVRAVNYGRGVRIYKCMNPAPQASTKLAGFVGTQSVTNMPHFRLVRTAARPLLPVTEGAFPPPEPGRQYAIVGQFDSGTDPNNPFLQEWIVDRVDDWHARDRQDNSHGSFVAGLIANGRHMNHGDQRFPAASAKIVDAVVFDKSGEVEESDLIAMIADSLERFPYVKVWNLSLASDSQTCDDERISEFGAALDELQREYGVLFVCAAGNLSGRPLRRWPVDASFIQNDRVAAPGDSFRSLTVGGIAHSDNERTCVRREEASPFSRRGPGVGCTIRPEVSHYAGNCDEDGRYMQTGVVSINGAGQIAEDVGVSCATPFVTAIAGNVASELSVTADQASPSFVKAMVVHSAHVRNGPINPEHVEYFGAGRPADADEILNCRQNAATIIFQVPAERRSRFYKDRFPMPSCLSKSGVLRGDIFMTLAYDPPLDRNFGIEYCRRDVQASLGTTSFNYETGAWEYGGREIPAAPHGLHRHYRKELADLGLQWSPLKLYHRRFVRGPAGADWRLSLPVLNRAERDDESPLPVTLIVTIRSMDAEDEVYNETVRAMDLLGWRVNNLQLRSRLRDETF